MSEENKPVTEPVDHATVVHDDPIAAEEKASEEIVAKVTKMLDTPGDKPEKSADSPAGHTGEGEKEKPPKAERPKDEESESMTQDLQARVEAAGMSKDLAERLHESGQLEETLAAFDRTLIQRFQSKETEEPAPKRREEKPPKEEPKAEDQEELPELDPDVYDEGLVKRDAYHKRRIDALEAQLSELVEERQQAFDSRFDKMVDGLGYEQLFGTGESVADDKQANRDILFRAYKSVCQVFDANPNDCNPEWGQRALAAMFPKEFFKKDQRQTVDRLRDAEGKFLTSSKPKGAPPAKNATPEESHDKLVSDVTSYLKKQGVQMSGV